MNKKIIISATVAVGVVSLAVYLFFNMTYYERLFNSEKSKVEASSKDASLRTREKINDFEDAFNTPAFTSISTESEIINDICLVDNSFTNTNMFNHLRRKKTGESMRCVYQVVKYYTWDDSARNFVGLLKTNQDELNLLEDYPYDKLAEIAATTRILETEYDKNPAVQIRFGEPTDSFAFTDTHSNYEDVIYQRRHKNVWEKPRRISYLPDVSSLKALANGSEYIIQVTFMDRYFTFYDNHEY